MLPSLITINRANLKRFKEKELGKLLTSKFLSKEFEDLIFARLEKHEPHEHEYEVRVEDEQDTETVSIW